MKKILYVRSAPYELSFDNYNLQEIGLATAFCKRGYDCDVVYYSKENRDQLINIGNNSIRILWRKGIKILRSGIYPQILNKNFLSGYDLIIVSEYNQIMTVLISMIAKNVYLYNGPYYNLFKIPFLQPIYDKLFVKSLNKRLKQTFVKSVLSKNFLTEKGLDESVVVGVGLDIEKYRNEKEIKINTQKVIDIMNGKRNLLYIGSLTKRKNFRFLISVFKKLKKEEKYDDLQLIVIGNGKSSYVEKCLKQLTTNERKSVIIVPFIENAQLKYIYPEAEMFLLPSIHEIFGMVLLEAMYFGLPVISSVNGGSKTLIDNNYNGVIVEKFEKTSWVEEVSNLLDDKIKSEDMGRFATETIKKNYLWDSICEKMMEYIC